jgi:hypothetical protein
MNEFKDITDSKGKIVTTVTGREFRSFIGKLARAYCSTQCDTASCKDCKLNLYRKWFVKLDNDSLAQLLAGDALPLTAMDARASLKEVADQIQKVLSYHTIILPKGTVIEALKKAKDAV